MASQSKTSAPPKKQPTPDSIMPVGAIRALLKQVKKDGDKELSCAVCLPESGDEAVILLERTMGPKRVRKLLIKEAKEAGLGIEENTIRFGKARTKGDVTDSEDEAQQPILVLLLNKELPKKEAFTKAIKRRIKSAKFKDVEFELDEKLDAEPEDGVAPTPPQQEAAPPPPPPPPQQKAPPPPPPPPPPPKQAAKPLDVAALTQRLSDLIKKIPGVAGEDTARQAELGGLARQAGALLKTGSPNNAALVMDDLEARLGLVGDSSGGLHGTLSAAKVEKSLMAWEAARARIVSEVEALKKAVADAFKGDEHEAQVTTALQQLDEIPRKLDSKLVDSLNRLKNEQDAEKRTQLTQQAQQLLAGYQNFVTANQVFPKLAGATPFGITLTIAPVADATFRALQASLH